MTYTDFCTDCGSQIHTDEDLQWRDNSGGDVCGVDGDNSPHKPYEPRTSIHQFSDEELSGFKEHLGNLLLDHMETRNGEHSLDKTPKGSEEKLTSDTDAKFSEILKNNNLGRQWNE